MGATPDTTVVGARHSHPDSRIHHFNNIKHAPEGHIRLEMRSAAAARPVQIVVHALDELLLDARGARLVARVHEVRAEQPRTLPASSDGSSASRIARICATSSRANSSGQTASPVPCTTQVSIRAIAAAASPESRSSSLHGASYAPRRKRRASKKATLRACLQHTASRARRVDGASSHS